MRPVTPAMFMRLPARMKKGTASSGKLSTPAIMRCASVTSGVMPVTRMYNSDEAAIASATGKPSSISIRNPPSSSSIGSPFRSVECAGALQDRIAAPPVLERDPDRVNDGRKRARREMRQIAEHQVDLDMPRQPHAHRRPQKHHADQAVG